MPEVTITLSEKEYGALCREAAQRGMSVGDLVAERLAVLRQEDLAKVEAILAKAREHYARNFPDESEDELIELAVEEVKRYRRGKVARERKAAGSDR